jgi:hypothetical protein
MTGHDERTSPARSWVGAGLAPDALACLREDLPATQLWSLLLDVVARRAARRTAAELARQWEADRFVAPSYVDQRTLNDLDHELLAAADAFEAVELSPLAPLAACSAVAPTSQNRVVATTRGAEVVSDPSNALALESAKRLRTDPAALVKLATSHRCVRAQEVPAVPGFAAHFRMFCMTTAGREQPDHALTIDAFIEHMRVHLRALDRLEQRGYRFPERRARLLSTPECERLAQRIAARVGELACTHEPLTHRYYSNGLRFMISARASDGREIPLIDGGAFDWVAQLAANRKLVFVASAIGSQLAAHLFRAP